MELIKQNIVMSRVKAGNMVQLTLDDDFNVPDSKPDVDRLIKEEARVVLTEILPMSGRFQIKGRLVFTLLYISEDRERPVHHITGEVPFEEVVNLEEVCGDEEIRITWELEDMTASLINSRKLNVRAILVLHYQVEQTASCEVAVGFEPEEGLQSKNKLLHITNAPIVKKDTFRMKDEANLPPGKPNIEEILYTNLELYNQELRLLNDKISIKGELEIFLLYAGDGQENQLNYWECVLPVSGSLDCVGCLEDMVGDIGVSLLSEDLSVSPDEDGEQRILDVEVVLELDMKLYQEEEIEILEDFYSTTRKLEAVKKEAAYKNLLMKNTSKLRLMENVRLEEGQPVILQVCNVAGTVKLDEKRIENNGILAAGVLEVKVLYITEEDTRPISAMKQSIPFEQLIEIKNISPSVTFEVRPFMEQLSTLMVSGDELELKAAIGLEALVFESLSEEIITDVGEEGQLSEEIDDLPGLVGYMVSEGESLWDIGKAFHTTVESIRELNDLETDTLSAGDKLLLMKEIEVLPLSQETPH